MKHNRFLDQNLTLAHFQTVVLVRCPSCGKRAVARVDYERKKASLICTSCGYIKEVSTLMQVFRSSGHLLMGAHRYFNAELWLQHPFKNRVFFALNREHLDYLEHYIGATLGEHRDRTHFTLVEKLPKFYHDSKNRDALLKVIAKLKQEC